MDESQERRKRILGLITAIQSGERDKLPALWDEVERLIRWWANRLTSKVQGVEFDDLFQCGYPALAAAVDTYRPVENASFPHWLAYYYKREIASLTGYRTKRQRQDPLRHAESLDAPVYDDNDTTLGDTIPDPSDPYESADARIFQQQLHNALENAMSELPDIQNRILKQRFYKGMTIADVAEAEHIAPTEARQTETTALRNLRRPRITRELRQFLELETPYYLRVGVKAFRSTGTSAVEQITLIRERLFRQAERMNNYE